MGSIPGWAYKQNLKKYFGTTSKTYLRNELKLTYHYILTYIYNTFIVRHNKRRIYFKNIYKINLSDCLKETQKEHTYTVDGLINGGRGLVSRWAFIRNNIFVGKWMDYTSGGGG